MAALGQETRLRAFLRRPVGVAGALVILLLVAIAVFAPYIGANGPLALSNHILSPPGAGHPLGTDNLGRDVLAAMAYGARVPLLVGCCSAAAAAVVGTLFGAVAAYLGGMIDTIMMRIAEFFQIMPSFILAVAVVTLFGPSFSAIVLVIAFLSWPQAARLARAEVLRVSQLDFVNAARCLGMSGGRILLAEIIPNAIGPVIAFSTLVIGNAILLETSLSFLGLLGGDVISWGKILNTGQQFLFTAWWLSIFPGMAILLTVIAFNLLGDTLTDLLNPRRTGA
jgi:peptide/nickel transport system permease protein